MTQVMNFDPPSFRFRKHDTTNTKSKYYYGNSSGATNQLKETDARAHNAAIFPSTTDSVGLINGMTCLTLKNNSMNTQEMNDGKNRIIMNAKHQRLLSLLPSSSVSIAKLNQSADLMESKFVSCSVSSANVASAMLNKLKTSISPYITLREDDCESTGKTCTVSNTNEVCSLLASAPKVLSVANLKPSANLLQPTFARSNNTTYHTASLSYTKSNVLTSTTATSNITKGVGDSDRHRSSSGSGSGHCSNGERKDESQGFGISQNSNSIEIIHNSSSAILSEIIADASSALPASSSIDGIEKLPKKLKCVSLLRKRKRKQTRKHTSKSNISSNMPQIVSAESHVFVNTKQIKQQKDGFSNRSTSSLASSYRVGFLFLLLCCFFTLNHAAETNVENYNEFGDDRSSTARKTPARRLLAARKKDEISLPNSHSFDQAHSEVTKFYNTIGHQINSSPRRRRLCDPCGSNQKDCGYCWNACGACCNSACTCSKGNPSLISVANGKCGSCNRGACTKISSCNTGRADYDGVASNGCEGYSVCPNTGKLFLNNYVQILNF